MEESINPDDIVDLNHKEISKIILKSGNTIKIDETVPSKKLKKIKEKRNSFLNYQISQRLINLTIISKKEKMNNENSNFNSKNQICKNIKFSFPNKKNKNFPLGEDINEKKRNVLFDNFKYSDIGKKYSSLRTNLLCNVCENDENNKFENLKTESINDKEIEKIKEVDIDLDSKSKNEYKTLINEFDNKRKDKLKLDARINNINHLLNSNIIIKDKKFDFTNHFNSLLNNFRNKVNDMKRENLNKRYYEIYKGINNRNTKNYLNQKQLNCENYKDNYISKSIKCLTQNTTLRNKNILSRKDNFFKIKDKYKKNSSFDPKLFRAKYLGAHIILPSNQLK